MGQPISNAAVEILRACRHSLRFAFGAPIGYPYAVSRFARDNPPPALFTRVQVAWPPPERQGAPWQTGLRTNSGPFDPNNPPEQLREVWAQEGAIALDRPKPDSIVLDWWFSVPRVKQTMTFPGADQDFTVLSVPYWNELQVAQVEYFATHRLDFTKEPTDEQRGDWIAISFDAFWPPERDSADVIAHLGDCDALCPPKVR
jgi:hypothetical protein